MMGANPLRESSPLAIPCRPRFDARVADIRENAVWLVKADFAPKTHEKPARMCHAYVKIVGAPMKDRHVGKVRAHFEGIVCHGRTPKTSAPRFFA